VSEAGMRDRVINRVKLRIKRIDYSLITALPNATSPDLLFNNGLS